MRNYLGSEVQLRHFILRYSQEDSTFIIVVPLLVIKPHLRSFRVGQ